MYVCLYVSLDPPIPPRPPPEAIPSNDIDVASKRLSGPPQPPAPYGKKEVHICTCTYMHLHVYIYMYMYVCMYLYMYIV